MADQNQSKSILGTSLDDLFQMHPIGSIDKAIGNNLWGINHRQVPTAVPSNKDMYGLTFFTRPQLNLQSDNIRALRKLYPLLTDNPLSIHRFVRTTLDPRLIFGYIFGDKVNIPAIECPVLDNTNAFIPVLTNNLNNISGWPDIATQPYASKAGLYKEVYTQVDDTIDNYGTFNLDASFRNTRGDPIVYMFYVWLRYAAAVYEGIMMPYLDFITENEIDYNTRIYRLVLDQNKEIVTKIAATIAFPISVPSGSFFDFNKEKPFNDQNNDITIRFQCSGAEYFDDVLIKEFNQTVSIFNPAMRDGARESNMTKIEKVLLTMFNNRGYPRINPDTRELEWWIYTEAFNTRTESFLKTGLMGDPVSKVEQPNANPAGTIRRDDTSLKPENAQTTDVLDDIEEGDFQ